MFINCDKNFDENDITVLLDNGDKCSIEGRGNASFNVIDRNNRSQNIILKDCLWMPTLNTDGIISIDQAVNSGYSFNFNTDCSYMNTNNYKIK